MSNPLAAADARVRVLNDHPVNGDGSYVLYWMQQSQRASWNGALDHAIRVANRLERPVLAVFALTDSYPEANERHYAFMLEGLAETAGQLGRRGVKLVGCAGSPPDVVASLASDAAAVVCDRGYLRTARGWRRELVRKVEVPLVRVESDVVVPVEIASDKQESAARTIRPKINRRRDEFLAGDSRVVPDKASLPLHVQGDVDLSAPDDVLEGMKVDRSVARSERFRGGISQARKRLTGFLRSSLEGYADARNDPADPKTSELSPYLHFGQISPLEIAHKVQRAKTGSGADKEAFLEELIVRRELAVNFVHYCTEYDSYRCLPGWAQQTLEEHEADERPHRYTRKQLERAETHDPYWNAAMREMTVTGYMHNYMRMYWGKKILEWSNTPRYAHSTALYLNNKYLIDGRDPNSYANVAWIFGLHDRAWGEREVFGKIRYMNASGLERKFDIDGYVRWTERLR